ncbi:amidase [Solirubrobacter sp. CPCC 204708]|uniref:Amidase family protein n=1 Tax=Solirubrobacter deserti TaxID=2282478 RepID=A0ABT4RQ60_9ACTN|nr:amidase family protein [Solirubrobacter deserti]MBE2320646.1 amidase [Solirubrobacter deserti]MDA0140700.1 amidase family protein [Solirubrobacter deserti]
MRRFIAFAGTACAAALVFAGQSSAFNYVSDSNGTWWGIQDFAPPRVDTGSIRATQIGPGQSPTFSTTINGFGGIKVQVPGAPRLNGELMRGFGLEFDGVSGFKTTTAVELGGVEIARAVSIKKELPVGSASYGRWLDTFTNTTGAPLTLKVAFGGQSGIGATGTNSSALVNTSSGDTSITAADTWAEVATPLNGTNLVGGPQATVIGTPAPFGGAMTFTGNWLHDTFDEPFGAAGHEGNFQAYVNTLTLQPGQTKSVLHFVVLGQRVNAASSEAERLKVETTAATLVSAPDLAGLSAAQVCSIDNFAVNADCSTAGSVPRIPVPAKPKPVTSSGYDVVEKSIGQMRADMESGLTTSAEITQAYLDRIKVYDQGQFGFNAYEIVAGDALEQARKADAARKAGKSSPVLGIPIAVKNLFDTYDMATTNGSMTFAGFRPKKDAFQVAKLREAGAVIIGKAALEEYATSGHYSNDAWGQTWNAFHPSKSALASSGGSATALGANLAAGALGSQTGDSLYAPASGASLVTLRGTDGMQSGTGVMPLSWMTDYGGAMARSVPDLADLLNVVTGTDPEDPVTAPADAERPADWRSVLDKDALKGKRIGYIPGVWEDPFGTTGTVEASKAALKYLSDAGATIVEMGTTVGDTNTPAAPAVNPPGNTSQEGWMQYIDAHPELAEQGFPIRNAVDVACSQKKVEYVRQDPSTCSAAPAARMTAAEIQARRDYRLQYKANAKTWLDTAGADNQGVDAVVYPGLLSDISLNDGGGGRAAFGRRDTPGAGPGIPTVVFPAGVNDHGQPINLQLLGRAWDDGELVGMAYAFSVLADKDGKGHVAATTAPALTFAKDTTGTVGGSVPATLSLSLGTPAAFDPFIPGVAKEYTTATDATVTSTAGDATLSVSGPGHLTNGAFALAEPLRVEFGKAAWTGPTTNETVPVTFKQLIKRTDPLRTGVYSKTLTFTLSTTNP